MNAPTLPARPMALLCAVLLFASVPLWEEAPFWTPALVIICTLGRIIAALRGWPLLPTVWRVLLLLLTAGGVASTAHTFFDVEPGFGILLVLVSLKMLETKAHRDFQVLVLLGFFLGLCSLFLSQELLRWLYVGTMAGLLVWVSIYMHTGAGPGSLLRSWRMAGMILAQSLPLAGLLFLFVPRPPGDFRLFPGAPRQSGIGMSDRMRPGTIASIASQPGRAFRVAFLDANPWPPQPYYWRAIVLWHGDGLNWSGRILPSQQPADDGPGERVRQSITLEPHEETWLFALDRPVGQVRDAFYDAGGALFNKRPIHAIYTYEVISRPNMVDWQFTPAQRQAALQQPSRVSPRLAELAKSLKAGGASDERIVERALAYFRKGNFTYSYNPGTYDSDALDEFLFDRKVGFCEHYAGAFASLMRVAGVPSRVVVGYLGGEESHYGRYLIVNQADAHAWCEVYLAKKGWVRLDPTSATAPARIASGLYSYLAQQQAQSPGGNTSSLAARWYASDYARELRLMWDSLTYQWDLRVLSFNAENQRDFLSLLGLGFWRSGQLFTGTMSVATLLLVALFFWLRHRTRSRHGAGPRRDHARNLFTRFGRKLTSAGLPPQEPAEGSTTYTERAAGAFPEKAAEIREVGQVYAAIRYGRAVPPLRDLRRAVRGVGRLSVAAKKDQ